MSAGIAYQHPGDVSTGSAAPGENSSTLSCKRVPDGFWAALAIFFAFVDFTTDILFCEHVKAEESKSSRAYFSASVAFIVIPLIINFYRICKMCTYDEVKNRFKVGYTLDIWSYNFDGLFFFNGPLTSVYLWYKEATAEPPTYNKVFQIWWEQLGWQYLAFLWPFFVVHWVLQVLIWIILLILFLLLLTLAIMEQLFYLIIVASNSELLFDTFGTKEKRMKIVCVGILLEDIPQLIIQGIYTSHRMKEISPIVVISLAMTAWHIGYSFVYNYANRDEDPLHVGEILEFANLASSIV